MISDLPCIVVCIHMLQSTPLCSIPRDILTSNIRRTVRENDCRTDQKEDQDSSTWGANEMQKKKKLVNTQLLSNHQTPKPTANADSQGVEP